MADRTVEEKYELAKMVLMLIERGALSFMVGLLPPEKMAQTLIMIANMAHVANHVNGENTFDCGPDRAKHHAVAIMDYSEMYTAMLADIADGNDVCQIVDHGKGSGLTITADTKEPEIDEEDLVEPISLN
jgi:hypothetical protein